MILISWLFLDGLISVGVMFAAIFVSPFLQIYVTRKHPESFETFYGAYVKFTSYLFAIIFSLGAIFLLVRYVQHNF